MWYDLLNDLKGGGGFIGSRFRPMEQMKITMYLNESCRSVLDSGSLCDFDQAT